MCNADIANREVQFDLSDSSFIRVCVLIQFTSHVLPPSAENACSFRPRLFLTVFSGEDCIFATILNNPSVKKGHGRPSDGNRANGPIRDP